jgi:hypothetical protein
MKKCIGLNGTALAKRQGSNLRDAQCAEALENIAAWSQPEFEIVRRFTTPPVTKSDQWFQASSPAAVSKQYTDQERYSDRVQGRFSGPASQAVKRRTRLPACFDSIGYGLSGFLDRLSSRLNGVLGLVELVWAISILQRFTFADHLSSPWQRGRLTPEQMIVPSIIDRQGEIPATSRTTINL